MRNSSFNSWMRKGVVGSAMLAAALVISPPADARPKHDKHHQARNRHHDNGGHGRHRHHDNDHGRVRYARAHRHPVFVAPRHLYVRSAYEPYFWGRVYSAPHHHHHVVYNFPRYIDDAVVYEPHAYCGEDLYATGRVEVFGPRFGFYLGF